MDLNLESLTSKKHVFMAKGRSKKNEVRIFVEVLQNGTLLSQTSKPFSKKSTIYLTANPKGELSAPYYPLPSDIKLITITPRGAELELDPNWEGFTTFQGQIEPVSSDRRSNYTHIMQNGDYGSIAYNDLRVLIRIGKARAARKSAGSAAKAYRGKFSTLWFGSKKEIKFLALASLATLWVFGSAIAGLILRPDNRPQHIYDLSPEYSLPFIDHVHIEHIPEALNDFGSPNGLIKNSFLYYQAVTDKILNYDGRKHSAIYDSSYKMYARLHRNYNNQLKTVISDQEKLEANILAKPLAGLISLPTVSGETFGDSILRLHDKLEILHLNFAETLRNRLITAKEFSDEKGHNYEAYKRSELKFGEGAESFESKMSKITAGLQESGITVFTEARRLANLARKYQRDLNKISFNQPVIDDNITASIHIDAENPYLSFLWPESFAELNKKLNVIGASRFDARRPSKVKEPLLGEINPKLIQNVVQKKRFEIQLCFELALRRKQDLEGAMEWQWRLDSRGRISDIELVNTTISDRRMIDCIRKKIARWQFPRPKRGSVEVSYPFRFSPNKG